MPTPRRHNVTAHLPWEDTRSLGAEWQPDIPDWTEQALCAQVGGDIFYPEKGESTKDAKKVCMRCTVRAECLDYAIASREHFGVWGGLSERQRRPLIKAHSDNELAEAS